MSSFMKRFHREDEGATMVEYGLMLALIAVVCIAAVTTIGTAANATFQTCGDELNTAAGS